MTTENPPLYEIEINKALFVQQEIFVYPLDTPWPDNIAYVLEFLFGRGAYLEHIAINGMPCIIVKNATFILNGAKTLNADWTFREVKQ